MRYPAALAVVLALTACLPNSADSSKLTLKNTVWEHVNVQVVITKSTDCEARGPEFVGSQDFVLHRDQSRVIVAPNGTYICWRHDRYPNNPTPSAWSGWSRAILFPDEDTTSEI
jgi:hypothetical protein